MLKKINLRIWSLKEEISHVILSKIDNIEEEELIKSLVEEYSIDKPNLRLIKNELPEDELSNNNDDTKTSKENSEVEDKHVEKENTEETTSNAKEEITQKIFKLPEDKVACATTIMSEIYMDEIYFFSETPFIEGQSIVMQFCLPQKFIMNADVLFCQAYSASNRVIGKAKLPYRVCAKFSFLRNGERTLLRRFLNSIEPEIKESKKEISPSQEEGSVTEEMFQTEEPT